MNRELVLVVDGDASMRERIKQILSKKFEVLTATNGQEALDLARKLKPQVILLELALSEVRGIEVCSKLRNDPQSHNCRFIIVTSIADPSQRVEAYNAGADDYIEKPFSPEELIARVTVKMRRVREESSPSQRILSDIILDFSKMCLTIKGGKTAKLGVTEIKILNVLLDADGKIVPRKQLSKEVWGDGADRVVDPHITSLRKKLSGSHVEIKTVYGEGYSIAVLKK